MQTQTSQMGEPLVSICCQTYNHSNFIEEALESFLMQKVDFNYEILLRDDASNDGTAEICKNYANKYPDKIKLLAYEENQFQKGVRPFIDNVKRAKGKYIAFCEGDDYWTDRFKLQKQINILDNETRVSIVGHNANRIDQNGNFISKFNENNISPYTGIKELLTDRWYLPTASLLFRKSALKLPKDLKNIINGDFMIQLLLVSDGSKVYYFNEIMSSYRLHTGGLSNQFERGYIFENSMIALHKMVNRETKGAYRELIFTKIADFAYSKLQKSERWSKDYRSALIHYIRHKKKFSKEELNYLIGHFILPKGWLSVVRKN